MSKTIAIIPARGGSKRIPRKNIKNFMGKPIIAWSIQAALTSKLFDVVMVSTDDEEIAEVAKANGAEIPFLRSKENSSDQSGTMEVITEVLNAYKPADFSIACCLYPCAPFVSHMKLQAAYDKMIAGSYDAVLPLVKYSTPIQRAFLLSSEKVSMLNPEYLLTRSQDLPAAYYDAGQFYIFKTSTFINQKKILTDNTTGLVISEMEAQDIDNETDWKMAELKFKLLNS